MGHSPPEGTSSGDARRHLPVPARACVGRRSRVRRDPVRRLGGGCLPEYRAARHDAEASARSHWRRSSWPGDRTRRAGLPPNGCRAAWGCRWRASPSSRLASTVPPVRPGGCRLPLHPNAVARTSSHRV